MNLEYGDFNNITFWAMNIPKEIKDFMNEKESLITKGMTDTELKAYKLGVDNTIDILKQLLDQGLDNESIMFYNPDVDITTEFNDEEVINWLNKDDVY